MPHTDRLFSLAERRIPLYPGLDFYVPKTGQNWLDAEFLCGQIGASGWRRSDFFGCKNEAVAGDLKFFCADFGGRSQSRIGRHHQHRGPSPGRHSPPDVDKIFSPFNSCVHKVEIHKVDLMQASSKATPLSIPVEGSLGSD